jgi:hypothetical protein
MGKESIRLVVLLLGVMLLLAGCHNHDSGRDEERRGGFYTGATGGWTRP